MTDARRGESSTVNTIQKEEHTMEAWGIIMTGFTLFSMIALVVASVRMEEGETMCASTPLTDEPSTEFKKAA
jgi:hypothetical protein